MSWKCYRIVYNALSSIHICSHRLGIINRTRYYIPGKSLWAAITADITRTYFKYEDYEEVGKAIKNIIIPGYLFTAIEPSKPFLPYFNGIDMKFGTFNLYEYESKFISSFGQTAIDKTSRNAEEATLHETEYINPYLEYDYKIKQVYFIGNILIKDKANLLRKSISWNDKKYSDIPIKEILKEICIGGERKYGFGRLNLNYELSVEQYDFFGYEINLTDTKPYLLIPKNNPILAHLKFDDDIQITGDIEPLVGREWKDDRGGSGHYISPAQICYIPGSITLKDYNIEIDGLGIWKKANL